MNNKPETVVKTTSVKVKNSEDKMRLFHLFKEYNSVCAFVSDEMYAFSGRDFKDFEGNVILPSQKIIDNWIKKYSIVDVETYKAKLQSAYNQFVNAGFAKEFASYLFQDATKSKNEDYEYLRDVIKQIPFKYESFIYDFLDGKCGYKYSVIGSVQERMSSFIECDKRTNDEYQDLKKKIVEIEEKLSKKYTPEEISEFKSWIEECANFKNETNPIYFDFNYKFVSFFNDIAKPALLNGKVVFEGIWKTKSGKKVLYSCDKKIIDLLYSKYQALWNKPESILNDALITGSQTEMDDYIEDDEKKNKKTLTELYDSLAKKKEYSSLKKINVINSPVRLKLGNNYVKFKLKHDSINHTLSFEFGYPKINADPKDKSKFNLVTSYKRVRHGQKCYLNDLVVEDELTQITEKNKKALPSGSYIFKYKINGKIPRISYLREPSIRLVVYNHKIDLNNPKPNDFDFYIDLCFNTVVENSTGFDAKTINSIRKDLSSAYPDNQTKKASDFNLDSINGPIRFMGIDLGLKNPFAFSVYEYSKDGNHKLIECGLPNLNKNPEIRKQYNDFQFTCNKIKNIISSTRSFISGNIKKDVIKDGTTKAIFDFVNNYFSENIPGYKRFSQEEYLSWLEAHKSVEIVDFKKKENNWIIRDWNFLLRKILIKMGEARRGYNEYCSHFDWIKSLESFRKLMTSYYSLGKNSTFGFGKGITKYKKIYNRIQNLKLDYIKKMSHDIAELAHKHNVVIVVTEKLDSMRGNSFNDKRKNALFNLWPVGQIKDSVEKALSVYGIMRADVDERNTSQVKCETGEWGFRGEGENIDVLHVSEQESVNADINAAKNICLRYLSKHTDYHALSFFKVVEDKKVISNLYVPVSAVKERKRERGFLNKHFGNHEVVFELSNNFLIPSSKNVDFNNKKNLKSKEIWYSADNTFKKWMSRESRNSIIDGIGEKVSSKRASGNLVKKS